MKTIAVVREEKCFGCTACCTICPQDAIQMEQGSKGFYIPSIREHMCVGCGMCAEVCPALQEELPDTQIEGKAYAVRHRSDAVRYQSSSGGAFTAIVDTGADVVYGAAYEGREVLHVRVDDHDIQRLRKSKYVQSDLNDTFEKVYADLSNKKKVIFCGTPCQCAGLREYLRVRGCTRENLLLLDFICHGTLSPRMFEDYLAYCERNAKKRIVGYCFRGKNNGWRGYQGITTYANGKVDSTSFDSQLCTAIYSSNYTYKEACYSCQYTSLHRVSDITLGDFWGIENHLPEFDDNKGISFVMINSSKGQSVFDRIDNVDFIEVPVEWTAQEHLDHPVTRPADNDVRWACYQAKGFRKMVMKYYNGNKYKRLALRGYHFGCRLMRFAMRCFRKIMRLMRVKDGKIERER